MSTSDDDRMSTSEVTIKDAISRILANHPAGAASLNASLVRGDVWVLELTPRHPKAAPLAIAHVADIEWTITFGQTHIYIEDDEDGLRMVEAIAEAVIAGRFTERGPRGDARALLRLADGTQFSGGAFGAGLWPWRRSYEPYL